MFHEFMYEFGCTKVPDGYKGCGEPPMPPPNTFWAPAHSLSVSTQCQLVVSTSINQYQVGCLFQVTEATLFQVTEVTLSSDYSRKIALWLFVVQNLQI